MKVYRIDYGGGAVSDWFVAESADDAATRWRQWQTDNGIDPMEPDYLIDAVVELAPDEPLTMTDDDAGQVIQSAAAWALSMPEGGYLGGTEF